MLAAALYCQAEVIVTANLKDFPVSYLGRFEVEAQHPDRFIAGLIELNPILAVKAFQQQISFLRKPPISKEKLLENFRKVGLLATADKLANLL